MRLPRFSYTFTSFGAEIHEGGTSSSSVYHQDPLTTSIHDHPRKPPMEDNLTPKQEEALKEFRDRVSPYCTDETELQPHLLCKWLIARNFSLEKSEKMFRKSQEWRTEIDAANLVAWTPPEVLKKYVPLGYAGFDKHGGSVVIVPHGRIDIKGTLLSARRQDYLKYTIRTLEVCKAEMAEANKKRDKQYCRITVIFDMEGFSIKEFTWKPALEAIFELLKIYEANYPEVLNCGYVINAPKVFSVAWTLLKPFLNENTINKVKIFGKSGWKEEVLKDVDAEVLPKHWGGTRVDPDGNEMCPSFVCLGGRVPTSYYLRNRETSHLTPLTVGKGQTERIPLTVKQPNSLIRWEFESDDYDIAFGIVSINSSDDPLVPIQRVDSHVTPEEGQVECKEPGDYTAVFDNSYSYMRSKIVRYCIDVNTCKPED